MCLLSKALAQGHFQLIWNNHRFLSCSFPPTLTQDLDSIAGILDGSVGITRAILNQWWGSNCVVSLVIFSTQRGTWMFVFDLLRRADASPGTFGGSARNQTRIKKQSRRGLSLGPPPSATLEASLRSLLSRSRRHSFKL